MIKKNYQPNLNYYNFKYLFILTGYLLLVLLPTTGVLGQVTQTFTTSGTFTVPCGVTSITVECWGGGGAGGGMPASATSGNTGGGGGGGGYARKVINGLIAGASYTVTVATAEAGGPTAGTNGNPSWFGTTSTVYAAGGRGGLSGTNGTFGEGGGGTGNLNIGDVTRLGGNGAAGVFNTLNGGGGGGGAGSLNPGVTATSGTGGAGGTVDGGAGGNSANNGGNGALYGGGGGGSRKNNAAAKDGGNGRAGQIKITYTPPAISSYCAATFSNNIEPITNVTFAGINNTTSGTVNGTPALEDFYDCFSGNVIAGSATNALSVSGNTDGNWVNWIRIYIDWNQNGTFEEATNERYDIGSITNCANCAVAGNITVPAAAINGNTRMRVIKHFNSYLTACGAGSFGQTEDYKIIVSPATPPNATAFSPPSGCAGSSVTISGTNLSNATNVTIGGTPVSSITSNTATQIVVVTGSGSTGSVVVTTSTGSSTAPGIFTITPSPTLFNVTGTGSYCPGGSGLPVGLSGSQATTVTYQLFQGATPIGSPVTGTGSSLSFGTQPTGTYTVVANNGVCTRTMTGSAIISPGSLPSAPTNTSANPSTICQGASSNLKASNSSVVITQSGFAGYYTPSNWNINNGPGGSINTSGAPATVSITSGDNGNNGNTTFNHGAADASGTITFNWSYTTTDIDPSYDIPKYVLAGTAVNLPGFSTGGANNQSGTASIPITAGQGFALRMTTTDGIGGSATTTFSNFSGPALGGTINWYTVPSGGTILGSSASGANFSVTPPSQGPNDYYAEAVSGAGCSSSSRTIVTVTVSAPSATASSNSPVCLGNNIFLSAGGGASYSWTGPNGFSSFFQNPNIASGAAIHSGTYTVVVTDALSCTASTTTVVSVVPNPVLSLGSQTNVSCFGLSDGEIDADASGGTPQYLYSDASSFNFDGIFTGLPAGTITIYVTDDNQCEASIPVTITQPDELIASAGGSSSVCEGEPVNLTSAATGGTQNYSYGWTGPNSFSSADQNPSIASATLADGGSYVVEITDANGCTDTETTIVTIDQSPTSNAGPDQSKCTTTATLAAVPSVGTGGWTVVSGGGTVTSPGSATSGVTGLTPGTNEFKWTETNGVCTPSDDNVIIDVTSPTSSNAGPDQSLCNALTGTLTGNTAVVGSGAWTVIAGGGTVTNPGNSTSGVTGLTPGTNTFRWTITYLTCASANDVDINIRTAAPVQPAITSGATAACPGDDIFFAINPVSQADSYLWYMAPGTTGVTFVPNNTTSTTASFSATNNSGYTIRVEAINSCGTGPFTGAFLRRTVSQPQIAGAARACPFSTKTYTVPAAITGAVNYTWYAPGASTITDGVNTGNPLTTTSLSADVTFHSGFLQGDVCVTATGPCGIETNQSCITVKAVPPTPASISGPASLCPPNSSVTYSTFPQAALTYTWSLPAGASVVSYPTVSSVEVSFAANYSGGNICVTADNACHSSPQKCKLVSSLLPSVPGNITGQMTGVCATTQGYSVPSVVGVTYSWSATNSAAVTPSANTASVNFLTATAYPVKICVTATNGCGTSNEKCASVKGVPAQAPSITGSSAPCAGVPESYSIAPLFGATTYRWQAPSGAVINDGFTTGNPLFTASASVTITFITGSGNVSVRGDNSCGSGSTKSKAVTISCREAGGINAAAFQMTAFPNPAHDKLTVSFESAVEENASLIITDLSGREILKQLLLTKAGENQLEMDLSKVAKGMYLLHLRSQNNNGQLPLVIE